MKYKTIKLSASDDYYIKTLIRDSGMDDLLTDGVEVSEPGSLFDAYPDEETCSDEEE